MSNAEGFVKALINAFESVFKQEQLTGMLCNAENRNYCLWLRALRLVFWTIEANILEKKREIFEKSVNNNCDILL